METNRKAGNPAQAALEQAIDLFAHMVSEFQAQIIHDERLMAFSLRQLVYLEAVAQMGEPTCGDLAKRLGVTKPSVTGIVGKLIQKGVMQKRQSGKDKRVHHIVLTGKGRELAALHLGYHRKIAGYFQQALDEREIAALVSMLQKVMRQVKS